jgi:hypothetical protein
MSGLWKDLEGHCRDLVETPFRNLHGGTEHSPIHIPLLQSDEIAGVLVWRIRGSNLWPEVR